MHRRSRLFPLLPWWGPLQSDGLEGHFKGCCCGGDEEDRFKEALRDAVQDTTANEGADDYERAEA